MAQALIGGMIRKGFFPSRLVVFDIDPKKTQALKTKWKIRPASSHPELLDRCRTVILATKPQDLLGVLNEIAPHLKETHLVISIAAGVDLSLLLKGLRPVTGLKGHPSLVRAMPNSPALIGEGITGLYAPSRISKKDRELAEAIFQGAGEVVWVKKEAQLDAVTALSGSGPAFVYRFAEALTQGGKKAGLPEKMAHRLALKTILGAALTLEKTKKRAQELIALVTSKKGTTLAGLKVLDQKKFDRMMEDTLQAAVRRAREIRRELKRKSN